MLIVNQKIEMVYNHSDKETNCCLNGFAELTIDN